MKKSYIYALFMILYIINTIYIIPSRVKTYGET